MNIITVIPGRGAAHLGLVGEHVDDHQEEDDQQRHPARDNLEVSTYFRLKRAAKELQECALKLFAFLLSVLCISVWRTADCHD